jgi:hypothetical protein
MARMGSYCKAYTASDLRRFGGWKERTDDLREEQRHVDGEDVTEPRTSLENEDVLYLQENYVVTHGIFMDEHIVFDDVTDGWKDFCHTELKFALPDHARPAREGGPQGGPG